MTENEALKTAIHCLGVQAEQEVCEECPVYLESGIACREIARYAISALEEIQQYRKTGTVEECQEAREKQKPKKPKKVTNSGVRYTDEYVCPNCEQHFTGTGIAEYCYHCGQAIDWNEDLEGMEDEQP